MAKQDGNWITRDEGDACQRELCGGKLRQRPDGLMECSQCLFTFNKRYQLGAGEEGAAPVIVPDEVITMFAKATFATHLTVVDKMAPSADGKIIDPDAAWAALSAENREGHRREAQAVLEKVWVQLRNRFGQDRVETRVIDTGKQAAEEIRALVTEIAIPSLQYVETRYGYDHQARLNLETGLGMEPSP